MTKYILFALAIISSQQAFALHWLNCSNADQSFSIVEHEVWGANPVGCSYQGGSILNSQVAMLKQTEVELKRINGDGPREFKRDFAVTVGFLNAAKERVETMVICREESDNAFDLVAPQRPCRITYEE